MVQVSTDEVYGDIADGALPCTEDAPLRPSSPYSASKTGGDLQVLAYIRTYGVDACITRGANNYGPRQYPEKLIPLFITNAFEGKELPVYGDGRQRREWLHADDYSSAIELVMRKAPSGEIYNVGGQERENMEVVRRILDLTGASPDLVRHVEDRPGHDRRYAVDSAKVRELGWAPAHNFKDGGLEETVAWYRENQAWWEPIKSGEYRAYYEEQYGKRLARLTRQGAARRGRTSSRDGSGRFRRTLVPCPDGPARCCSGGLRRAPSRPAAPPRRS